MRRLDLTLLSSIGRIPVSGDRHEVDVVVFELVVLVVLVFERVDNTWDSCPLFDLVLLDVLDVVVPDQAEMFRLVCVEPGWFDHCSATMLNIGILDDCVCFLIDGRTGFDHAPLVLSCSLESIARHSRMLLGTRWSCTGSS